MTDTFTISLAKPIKSASLVAPGQSLATHDLSKERQAASDEGRAKAEFAQVCQTLKTIVNKMNQLYGEMLTKHGEEIAKLSVEIANKVLMQKVQKGDYRIESIIAEALKSAPTCQDVVVHLNPEDLAQCQKLLQEGTIGALEGVKFVSDPNIGRAECLLETPKGIVKSFIKEHIEQISGALSKVK